MVRVKRFAGKVWTILHRRGRVEWARAVCAPRRPARACGQAPPHGSGAAPRLTVRGCGVPAARGVRARAGLPALAPQAQLNAASMKPFVKTVPPGESGEVWGSRSEPFPVVSFLGSFLGFLQFSLRCHWLRVSTLGCPPGGIWGFRPLLMPTSHTLTSERRTGPKPLPSERSSLS